MLGSVSAADADLRARAFVAARSEARVLADYPGAVPTTLAEAYRIQDHAITLWPDRVAGWKVGRIHEPWASELGTDRLAGPIFRRAVTTDPAGEAVVRLFRDGFGAVEGELVLVTAVDVPPRARTWDAAETLALVRSAHLGVEVASSPFPGINDQGPLVTISDFGNNNGLIVGPALAWANADDLGAFVIETRLDGETVGCAAVGTLPGGPLESLRKLLGICAQRRLELPAGTLVSTGAVTGVHVARAGQQAEVAVAGYPAIRCRATYVAGSPGAAPAR